jgi:hypothetical protein
LRQRLQRVFQIAPFGLAQGGDDVPDLAEESARKPLRFDDMFVGPAGLGDVACDFELSPSAVSSWPQASCKSREMRRRSALRALLAMIACADLSSRFVSASARDVSASRLSACAVKTNKSCSAKDFVRTQHKSGLRACASVPIITRF